MADTLRNVNAGPDRVPLDSIRPHPRNVNEGDVGAIHGSLTENGWYGRVLVQKSTGLIVAGKHRWLAAQQAGESEVDIEWLDVDDDQALRIMLVDNQTTRLGMDDPAALSELLAELAGTPAGLAGTGFDPDDLDALLAELASPLDLSDGDDGADAEKAATLAERFGVPPFSVLDTRRGPWRNRKRAWLALGIRSELGRGDVPPGGGGGGAWIESGKDGDRRAADPKWRTGGAARDGGGLTLPSNSGRDPDYYRQKQAVEKRLGRTLTTDEFDRDHYVLNDGSSGLSTTGTSVFDPVLCELAYAWFSRRGGRVLDPFAGGSVRGVVAAALHREYVGIDLAARQVTANAEQWEQIRPRLAAVSVAPPPAPDHQPDLTPVEAHGGYAVKRDDTYRVAGVAGGKVRTCWTLATADGVAGLVTAGSRQSPQVNIVAQIAQRLGLPCRVHVPAAKDSTPEVTAARAAGAEVIEHRPGYNTVIVARAREDAAARADDGWIEVPFGMECEAAVAATASQVANVPEGVSRIVVPVGSGMTLAGILRGLDDAGRSDLPVLGVQVGADPTGRLDAYAPGWADRVTLVSSDLDYHDHAPETTLGDLILDPVYEAKCLPYLADGDLLWVVGIRMTAEAPPAAAAAAQVPAAPAGDERGWTYGMEVELADFRWDRPPPEGVYVSSEPDQVNSDGRACDPDRPVGGEVNTWPTSTPAEQGEAIDRFFATYPEARVNHRSTTHGHIHVPGLADDLDALKRVVRYSRLWTPWVCEQVYRVVRPDGFDALPKPAARWRHLVVGTAMPTEWREQMMLDATTLQEFWDAHMRTKAGKVEPLQARRYAVNLMMLRKQPTVEFRHFLGVANGREAQTVADYCREFMVAALETDEPMPEVFARHPEWEFTPPQTVDLDLEAGHDETNVGHGRSTPKVVLAGTKVGYGSAADNGHGVASAVAATVDPPAPTWIAGDSNVVLDLGDDRLGDEPFDMIFTCPPYADLEVYSDDPADLSAMDYDDFLRVYGSIFRQALDRLADDRFVVVVVGEVRGPDGNYRGFVSDTIRTVEAAGCRFYNEAILVQPVGSLPVRIGRQFAAGRKLGKTHQNVLVFAKGDGRAAAEACGVIEVDVPITDDSEDGDEPTEVEVPVPA